MPAEAPVAPPSAVTEGAPTTPPPAPAPKGEIHLTAPTQTTTDQGPATAPKKGSAMERLQQDLRKKAKPQFFEPREETPASSKTEGQPAASDPGSKETDPGANPQGGTAPSDGQQPPAAGKEKTAKNPWKLVDEYKARATKAESELVEAKKIGGDPAKLKEFNETIASLRKQNEELETEIRFTNYAKSAEFKTKFHEPYEKAWLRATKELSEVTVTDPATGAERASTVADLADIVNLPLGKARAAAEQIFGPFADDVMAYRKEILQLNEARETALKDAHDNSIKRDKELAETQQRTVGEIATQIKDNWEKANNEWISDEKVGVYFRPVEGDQDGNQRLAKGFELVDRAFSENPNDPKLTAEQRASIIKRHAAVRLRAAAFGRIRAQYDAAKSRIAELEKELGEYKDTTPRRGGSTPAPGGSANTTSGGMSRIRAELQKIAH